MPTAHQFSFTTEVNNSDLLTYTGAIVPNGDGVNHYVIDVDKLDWGPADLGSKRKPTCVIRAQGGEYTAQIFKYSRETRYPYIAQAGEAIFVQGDVPAALHYMKTSEIPDRHSTID